MTKDVNIQEKTLQSFRFTCACGCGQMSDNLDSKSYIRLRKGQKWYAKGCLDNREIIAEVANGYVTKESDF